MSAGRRLAMARGDLGWTVELGWGWARSAAATGRAAGDAATPARGDRRRPSGAGVRRDKSAARCGACRLAAGGRRRQAAERPELAGGRGEGLRLVRRRVGQARHGAGAPALPRAGAPASTSVPRGPHSMKHRTAASASSVAHRRREPHRLAQVARPVAPGRWLRVRQPAGRSRSTRSAAWAATAARARPSPRMARRAGPSSRSGMRARSGAHARRRFAPCSLGFERRRSASLGPGDDANRGPFSAGDRSPAGNAARSRRRQSAPTACARPATPASARHGGATRRSASASGITPASTAATNSPTLWPISAAGLQRPASASAAPARTRA